MMPKLHRIVSYCLRLPSDALVWEANRLVTTEFPDKYILETGDYDFQLADYARSGRCHIHPVDDSCAQFEAEWRGKEEGAILKARNAFLEVLWRGQRLYVLSLTYSVSYEVDRHWIIADDMVTAKEFFSAVCAYSAVVEGNILVFQGGCWRKDARLMQDIASSRLDDLVLPPTVKSTVIHELDAFFSAKEIYESMGVAWKRGLLFVGPPGNGKTHAIKALVQHTGKPCLYIRSFKGDDFHPPQMNVEMVFRRARQAAPCILVLEDLDSLLDKEYLSAFLNAMDGFADNSGIFTIATTNHPDKIDIALVERPSRFDRKVEFTLPEAPERASYIQLMDARRTEAMRMTEEDVSRVVKATAGYSFALLKELHVASTMGWMEKRETGTMGEVTLAVARQIYRGSTTKKDKKKKEKAGSKKGG